ncbi:MAG: hypothetical protein RHS_1870 [Robinsoniella sp. RHS]|nr:MAG: hypothetical protein RHS_1870 [Robinsoniella sp. RHS]
MNNKMSYSIPQISVFYVNIDLFLKINGILVIAVCRNLR